MWLFEQAQGIGLGLNVFVNVRMVVLKLNSGGLWILNPVAPTAECLRLLRELEAPVEAIVLGTTLYEHKVFLPAFARNFPGAKVFAVPRQWAYPFNLPPPLLGFPWQTRWLEVGMDPWPGEIEFELCSGSRLGFGYYFVEAAFCHLESSTLLVTDAVAFVSPQPPEALERGALESFGDTEENVVLKILRAIDYTDINRRLPKDDGRLPRPAANLEDRVALGWRRNALFALFITPDGVSIFAPESSGVFPRLSGRVLVPPVVLGLVFAAEEVREPVLDWVDRICARWPQFYNVVPAHFAGPVSCKPAELKEAFAPLRSGRPADYEAVYGKDSAQLITAGRALRACGVDVGAGGEFGVTSGWL